MIYQKSVTIASGKTKASPEVSYFQLTQGILTKIDIGFPAGCLGLVGLRVFRGGHQLFPMVQDEWFVTDDYTISFPIEQEVEAKPLLLRIEGFNVDDTYGHTITLRLSIDRPTDINRDLLEVVSARLPERTEEYLQGIGAILDVNEEVRGLLEEGVIPSIDGVLQLMKEEKERDLSRMSIDDLTRI